MRNGYERSIWVYRCVDAIASNSSGVPMVVREYNDLTGKIIEDPEIDMLFNRRPNSYETAQMFRYRVATQALLSRRGVFIEVVRNRMGRPIELHVLPNGATTPIPDANTYVSGYEVVTLTQGIVTLTPEQVIWLRVKAHPTDVYAQMTPLVAAGIAADTDFLARLYNRNFLANDGRPGMLIAVQGQMGVEDADELKRRFSGGPSAAGQTTVIEADGISATDMSASPRDVQWQEAVRGSKEDILLAFGVPESVLGNASGRTFDNADAEFEVFWEVTMQPFMDAMASAYDTLTIGGSKDNLLVAHNYMTVDVLQRKARRDRQNAMAEVQSGLMTIDEFFNRTNQPKFDVAGTRVLWVPPGSVPVGKDEADTKEAAKLTPVGAPPPPDPFASQGTPGATGPQLGSSSAMNIQAARAWRLAGRKSLPLAVDEKPRLRIVK
jgi:HK97 family phage portal protein